MLKMAVFFLSLFFLSVSSVAGQELLQILSIHQNDSTPNTLQTLLAVSVHQDKLNEVSKTILMAEKWLKINVLSVYPNININSIVVSNELPCDQENGEEISRFTVNAMENIHHSLVRWGLEKKIKVSVFITPKCLKKKNDYFKLKNVFGFLDEINSTCTMKLPDFSEESFGILSSQLSSMADLGVFKSKSLNILTSVSLKPLSRKLSSESYSIPSDAAAAATPLPPLVGISLPPPLTPPLSPEIQPPMYSSPPHYDVNLPPCNPHPNPHPRGRHNGGSTAAAPPPLVGNGGFPGTAAPPPFVGNGGFPATAAPPPLVGNGGFPATAAPPLLVGNGGFPAAAAPPPTAAPAVSHEGVWCVAKPSVPSDMLQEAMDYACGEGGGDCEAISPAGSCYFPDSIVAHASYAFNSYWQKNKKNGGTCGFGGTAMLISSDPSFMQCHFTLE